MKKTYEKPQIIFESFELSQSIAAGCAYQANAARGICGFDTGVGILFTAEVLACLGEDGIIPAPGDDDSICYHAPGDNSNVFSS